ncbi:hypothetical protein JGI20_00271, partial [Candidatus Kryptobacter tengchongensis]
MRVRVLKINTIEEAIEEFSRFGEVEPFLSSEFKPEKFVCVNLKIENATDE